MSNRRIAIAAGGTGGHVFPAVSLAHQLKEKGNVVFFLGGGLESNPFFQSCRFPFCEISCRRPSWRMPAFPLSIGRGVWQSMRLLKTFLPDLLIGFGSYYTFPALIAARLLRIPYVIHEQNSILGRVNRLFTKSAQLTAVHFPSVFASIKGNCRLVAMPLRPDFDKKWEQREAKFAYGLDPDFPVLLVFGGSQGAEAINQLLYEAADFLKSWQVLHFTGDAVWEKRLSERYRAAGIRAKVKIFEQQMAKAWGAADLSVSRAGAVSIAEQLASAVPGILIPYPFATDQHQDKNADYLAALGGALKFSQQALTPRILSGAIHKLFPELDQMRSRLKEQRSGQIRLIDCLDNLKVKV